MLIYAILDKKVLINNCLIKNNFFSILKDYNNYQAHPIRANVNIFFQQLNQIIPSVDNIDYMKNCFLMLEGESSFFEDINIFLKQASRSNILFMQVKGTMATDSVGSLDSAIISTIGKLVFNKNFKKENKLFMLINKSSSSYLLLKTEEDRKEALIKVLREIKLITIKKTIKGSEANGNKFYKLLDEYLETEYSKRTNIRQYLKLKNPSIYNFFESDLKDKILIIIINRINKILKLINVIENLDHRLICLLLYTTYGEKDFFKLLWNIEMKSMDSTYLDLSIIQSHLKKIGFEDKRISEIIFSKDKNKVSIGKILE